MYNCYHNIMFLQCSANVLISMIMDIVINSISNKIFISINIIYKINLKRKSNNTMVTLSYTYTSQSIFLQMGAFTRFYLVLHKV